MDEWKRDLLTKINIRDYSICKIYTIRGLVVFQLVSPLQTVKRKTKTNPQALKIPTSLKLVFVDIDYVKLTLASNPLFVQKKHGLHFEVLLGRWSFISWVQYLGKLFWGWELEYIFETSDL